MNKKWTDVKGRYIRDPKYGHRLGKLYITSEKIRKSGYQSEIAEQSTDQYGFVDNGYSRKLPDKFCKDHIGIVIIGGSSAMGLGATSNSKTISAVLEKNLRDKLSKIKISVINAGCGGYHSWDEMIYLLTELILRKPQIVISYTGLNDFCAEYFGSKYYDERIPNTSRSLEDVAEAVKLGNFKVSFTELAKYKFKKTNLYGKLINIFRSQKGKKKLNEQNFIWGLENLKRQYNPKIASQFWINQMSILGACKVHNINYHLYIQSCYFWNQKKIITDQENIGIEYDKELLKKDYGEQCQKYFDDLRNEVKYFSYHFDGIKNIYGFLNNIFDDVKEQCYVDHCHLSNKGQEIVGKEIAKNILCSKIIKS